MSGYIGNIPVPQATQTRQSFTATASQTTFNTAGYSVGYVDVFLNGVKLAPADYTATNGSDIILAVGAASGDILEIVAYEIFQVVDQNFTGDFTVDGTTFVVDSTNNRVGVGTSTPSALIHASGAAASGGAVEIRLEDTAASSNSRLMRTGSAYSYAGVGANETWLYHAGAGTINIGPDGAGTVKIVNGGSERMRITTDKVQFNVDAKVDADNARDLGAGGARWKDLYLSGGVYVGGTGAANYLDDYEEGTYYPELTSSGGSFSSVTYNTQLGNYVIVGDIIHVAGNIGASAISGGSGTLYITLPASCPSGIGGAGGVVGYISGLNYNSPTFNQVGLYISNGGGALLKFTCSGDDTSAIETPISNFTSVFNCTFQVSYRIT